MADYEVYKWEISAAAHRIVVVEKVGAEDENAAVSWSALFACCPGSGSPLSDFGEESLDLEEVFYSGTVATRLHCCAGLNCVHLTPDWFL